MNLNGKVQLTMVFVATPELEAEGDHVWKSHATFMEKPHYRDGEKAFLQYTVAKGTDDDGKIHFVVTEVYESVAGLNDHREQGQNWEDHSAFQNWVGQCESSINVVTVIDSLW